MVLMWEKSGLRAARIEKAVDDQGETEDRERTECLFDILTY